MAILQGGLASEDILNKRLIELGISESWDMMQVAFGQYTEDLNGRLAFFVRGQTTDPGHFDALADRGQMQKSGGKAAPHNVKRQGDRENNYGFNRYHSALGWDDWTIDQMTVGQMLGNTESIIAANQSAHIHDIFSPIFDNTQYSFKDEVTKATLTLKPLANGDSDLYPNAPGNAGNSTANNYLATTYDGTGISDSNNPFATMGAKLKRQSGVRTSGQKITFLINPDITAKTQALTEFVDVSDFAVSQPDTATTVNDQGPPIMPFGRILGRLQTTGAWVTEWDQMLSGYVYGQHLGFKAPLIKRVLNSAEFGPGLRLFAQNDRAPLHSAYWRDTFGYGVRDRLNGCVLQLKGTSGAYVIPTF